ncbi:MAG TPA: VCBS repeat-containing protein [Pirellulales bacterium]|nr:VCBS repeat-containing protein [Pirellulales bacterium]
MSSAARANSTTDALEAQLLPVNEPLVPANFPAPLRAMAKAHYCSGGETVAYAWHLSVINGGSPRAATTVAAAMADKQPNFPWPERAFDLGRFTLRPNAEADRELAISLGTSGATPVTGDFNGDGLDELALFVDGQWFIDLNGDRQWNEKDLWVRLGKAGDLPVVGDWDGDGKADIGVFGKGWMGDTKAVDTEPGLPDVDNRRVGAKNSPEAAVRLVGYRILRNTAEGVSRTDGIDHVFQFGAGSDIPVVGDWNGDGIDNIGIFRRGHWVLDTNGDGRFDANDRVFEFGEADDLPVVADFNSDGIDEIGVYRRGVWHLDADNDRSASDGDRHMTFGDVDDLPVVGDFDGSGAIRFGVYSRAVRPDRSL